MTEPANEPINPYAASTVDIDPEEGLSEAEKVRRNHLAREKSIDSIASLSFITAVFTGLGVIGVMIAATQAGNSADLLPAFLILGAVCAIHAWTGFELSFYTRRGRVLGIILSTLWLIWFPVGTMLGIYFLYLLLSAKGVTVCSPEYRRIRSETPHIKYRTSALTWATLVVFIIALVAFVVWQF